MYEIVVLKLETQVGDWTVDKHTAHGNVPHAQKHVHIRKRHLKGEYSWNKDGTRHDEHKFPPSEQMIKRAKELAAEALGVSSSSLQLIANVHGTHEVRISIHNDYLQRNQVCYSTRVAGDEFLAILEAEQTTVVVRLA